MLKKIFLLIVPLLFLFSSVLATVTIDSCGTLNQVGEVYELNQSIIATTNNCLSVTVNATIDCKGYSIDGQNLYTNLIYNGREVRNCVLENSTGWALTGSNNDDSYFHDSIVRDCSYGIENMKRVEDVEIYNIPNYVADIRNSEVQRWLRVTATDVGSIYMSWSGGAYPQIYINDSVFDGRSNTNDFLSADVNSQFYIYDSNITDYYMIIDATNNRGGHVTGNRMSDCNYALAWDVSTGDNAFWNNYVNCSVYTPNECCGISAQLFRSPYIGDRIYDVPFYTGNVSGNLWVNPSNNGHSQTCPDYDMDGFCDTSLTIGWGVNTRPDILPYSYWFESESLSCYNSTHFENNITYTHTVNSTTVLEFEQYTFDLLSNSTSCYNTTTKLINETYQDLEGCGQFFEDLSYENCPLYYTCSEGSCQYGGYCGDYVCQIGTEDQDTCCVDCGCPFYHRCENNVCVETYSDVAGGLGEEVGSGIRQMAIPIGGTVLFLGIIIIMIASIVGGIKDNRGR